MSDTLSNTKQSSKQGNPGVGVTVGVDVGVGVNGVPISQSFNNEPPPNPGHDIVNGVNDDDVLIANLPDPPSCPEKIDGTQLTPLKLTVIVLFVITEQQLPHPLIVGLPTSVVIVNDSGTPLTIV